MVNVHVSASHQFREKKPMCFAKLNNNQPHTVRLYRTWNEVLLCVGHLEINSGDEAFKHIVKYDIASQKPRHSIM